MSLRTTSQNRASTFTFTNSRSGGSGGVGTGSVTITSIVVTDSGFNNLDDNAVGTSNSYIKIIGTGFSSSANVFVSGSQVSSVNVTYVNSTEIRVTLPSLSLGNTNIFVFNPDYSGAIWAPGITVSGFPDFTQTSYTSSTPLEVSVQLLATGDAPLTYALQAGSSLPSGCSLSSSGLITGTTTDGVYQFTVIVSDAQLQSFQYQITLTITSGDQYFNRTVLAINGDVNTFVSDASSNNFLPTITGTTLAPTAFSPYNTNWSNLFDGTGDYLTVPELNISSSTSFTIEFWFYWSASPSSYSMFVSDDNGGSSKYIAYNVAGATLDVQTGGGAATVAYCSFTPILNRWYHLAFVRNTNTITIYVNGVAQAMTQATQSGTFLDQGTINYIGRWGGTTPYAVNGYMSNLRAVVGSAVYTSNFTPPSSPLTVITNTSLLTCQSSLIIDKSNNASAITVVGDTKVSNFGPFIETNLTAGSTYFDTSQVGLTISSNAALNMGTGDFTIEGWYYPNAADSTFNSAFYLGTINGANALGLAVSNVNIIYRAAGSGDKIVVGSLNLTNSWNHIALVRSSGTTKIYLNGIAVGSTYADPTNYSSSGNLLISRPDSPSFRYVGHIADFRIVKGTAVYTANFNPPTSPLTAIANTSLLILQTRQPINNHTFIDESGNNLLITKTGNVSQGSFSPFSPAGWSNYFDGSGDYLRKSGSGVLTASGDVTIECWMYPATSSVIGLFDGGSNEASIIRNYQANKIAKQGQESTGAVFTATANQWQHFAATFSSGNITVYINGTVSGTGTYTSGYAAGLNFDIGGINATGDGAFSGYISNFRVTKSLVYTSAFTPPTSTLTAIANTSLLTCQSNRFIDSSNNTFAVTVVGNPSVKAFAPFRPTNEYSLATHDGSIYFDGTGDYLDTSSSSAFAFGTGDFTVEGWFYLNRTGQHRLIDFANERLIYIDGNTRVVYYLNGNAIVSSALVVDAWYHFALSRSSGSTKLFLNGVQAGSTYTDSANYPASAPTIGRDRSNTYFHQGYISDLCVSKTARYTSNFSVPTTPISLIPNSSLILKSNPAIVDVSSRNVMETVGGARIVTSTRKYGTGSMYFDGTDDRLTFPANSFFAFPGDFTIEFWSYNLDVSGSTQRGYLQISDTAGGLKTTYTSGITIAQSISGGGNLGVNIMGTALNSSAGVIIANQWQHIAVTRASGVVTLFVNGTQVASSIISNSITGQNLVIGGYYNTTYLYNGYIDDLRITNGYARYTANFTAPTTTFLAQ
jgi:hypothetical protein